jgi:hypothetical protein
MRPMFVSMRLSIEPKQFQFAIANVWSLGGFDGTALICQSALKLEMLVCQ